MTKSTRVPRCPCCPSHVRPLHDELFELRDTFFTTELHWHVDVILLTVVIMMTVQNNPSKGLLYSSIHHQEGGQGIIVNLAKILFFWTHTPTGGKFVTRTPNLW